MTDTSKLTRRSILGGLAAAGTALAGCGDDTPTGPDADVTPLNNLLAAEQAAIKAYDAGRGIVMSAPDTDPQAMFRLVLVAVIERWKAQHEAHAAQLTAQVRALRGTPVAPDSAGFQAPTGFTPSITNVLILAANAERGAAVAYNTAMAALKRPDSRTLAASIEGDETQHFAVLSALLNRAVSPGSAIVTGGVNDVVPQAFVLNAGGMMNGLESVADFTFA
ncbi:MAG: ferritin-like domain-containing protein [Polyangiales bacterium]